MLDNEIYDITIIGAGPVGLFAAFYGGLRQKKVKIIDSLPYVGGQLATLYPEKYIYDIAGFQHIRAGDLIQNLEKQIEPFNQTYCLEEEVQQVSKQADASFLIKTNKGDHISKTIIITAGNGSFNPRPLLLKEENTDHYTNLHYHIVDFESFRDQRVAVFGGGDSALDWSLMLANIAREVTIIHRRNDFRAHEHSVAQLKNTNVKVLTPFTLEKITGQQQIDSVTVKEVKGITELTLLVDQVLVSYGFISTLGPIKDWGLSIEKNNIVVNSKMETNIPGIYAAGDICTYPGKVKLIAAGFGEGPTAINNAIHYMEPKERIQPKHSTSLFH